MALHIVICEMFFWVCVIQREGSFFVLLLFNYEMMFSLVWRAQVQR